MSPDLELDEFLVATPDEWIGMCREMAEEAARLARDASGDTRAAYLVLAQQWTALADEMEVTPSVRRHH